jgi:hypothetical protein
VLASLLVAGCASRQDLASELVAASTQGHLQPVVACWEKEFEANGFQGAYTARVDFEIAGSSRIQRARVTSLEPKDQAAARDTSAFRACLEHALDATSLPTSADAEGPGFSAVGRVTVRNFRIDFADASSERRKAAEGRQSHVLLGPRADRCQGLYAYDPPRDASSLYNDIALGQSRAERMKTTSQDDYARELQKTYDTQLELSARLEIDLADPALPERNKKRLREALDNARKEVRRIGAAIGCTPAQTER